MIMSDTLVVQTNCGAVRGRRRQGTENTTYYSFQRIPYAKPPIGELRFKAPQKHEQWSDVLDATTSGPIAHQHALQFSITLRFPPNPNPESEDCLYVNVYTKVLPNAELDRKLPVLVMLHGGGFNFGSSGEEMQCPDFLLEHDILYISVNYRLGVFGFLSIDDRDYDIPGNAGLKDQSMALRWVAENCDHFGGDRHNITIFGESAGGASVHFHLMSNQSKDLFHRAIIQSGSALCPWAHIPASGNTNERLARALGWNGDGGSAAMFRTIIDAPAAVLSEKQGEIFTSKEIQNGLLFQFVPIVEPYDNGTVFLYHDLQTMNRTAWGHRIPLLIGGNSGEGYMLYQHLIHNKANLNDKSYFENALPRQLNLSDDAVNRNRLGDALRNFYFSNETQSLSNLEPYIDLLSEMMVWNGIQAIISARLSKADSAPTYLYYFDYSSDVLLAMQMIECGKHVERMVHAEDLFYQFRTAALHDALPDDGVEVRLRKIFNSLCVSFAATGQPSDPAIDTLNWEPVCGPAPFKCLNLAVELSVIDLPNMERLHFWESLYNFVKQTTC